MQAGVEFAGGVCGRIRNNVPANLAASSRSGGDHASHANSWGFRVASIPEPGTGLLLMAGLAGLAALRRGCA